MNDIPARTYLDVTAPILRSKQANDSRSSASGPIRALGWVMAAWCLGFAAVNIAFEVTGRFASGPYAELAAGLAVMDWIEFTANLRKSAPILPSRSRPSWPAV